ncbi:GNAT family N-acetyltransferase [Nocardioides currus]|uniref:GNAT family N-acetyltransferase n=1 Tax=Nocardioides currus TaxID=2133958 RepID=A0A2R7Z226_9ACTN|nr:GNAT family N-acetyltransferase [Nocardioides currus]PUA82685.1 GNAT family N-acetyltransferase [Nocardioides currus]
MDYDFATLDLSDESDAGRARRSGWLAAVQRGFHSGRPDEEFETRWLTHVRADGAVCTGAWLPEGEFGAGPVPVATYCSFDKTLNAGHELVPLRMVTDVTASPAHRRQGLVRRLIEADLADAVAHGIPVAALTASEATIYGRWGFGAAVFAQKIELDTGPRFGLRAFSDPGRVELIEPPDSWPIVKDVFDRFHAQTRGSVEWPQFYEVLHTGAFDFGEGGPDKKLRGAVHLDAEGTIDGVVLYKADGRGDERKINVTEMMALTTPAGLALWRFLGSIDMAKRVTFGLGFPDDPLRWALTDINAVSFTAHEEFLWVRVLDVVRALAARPWTADDEIVLEVEDAQGHAAGRYRIVTASGRAEVTRTDDPAEVTLTAETLGSLYLGGANASALARAGRVHGTDAALARFAAMADLAEPPYSLTGF